MVDLLVDFPGVSCVGIGKADNGTGRAILYFGVTGFGRPNELWRAEMNGTSPSVVTEWPGSGNCVYVVQQVI